MPSSSNKIIIASLITGCIVLLYMKHSTMHRSEDQSHTISEAAEKALIEKVKASMLSPAERAEKALIEKVKASMLSPAVRSVPIDPSMALKTYFSQFQQDELVEKMTRKKVNGTFFEAGALEGEALSNTLHLERALGWTGLLVEPGKNSFDQLKKKGRRARLLHACLSPDQSASEMSFDPKIATPELAKLLSTQNKKTNGMEMVSCYPLYTILQAMDVPIIDYLSLDIEGNELKVLKTVPWDRVKVRVMGVEITHIVPEGPEAVKRFMVQKGYVFYKQQGEDYFFYHPDFASELDLS